MMTKIEPLFKNIVEFLVLLTLFIFVGGLFHGWLPTKFQAWLFIAIIGLFFGVIVRGEKAAQNQEGNHDVDQN